MTDTPDASVVEARASAAPTLDPRTDLPLVSIRDLRVYFHTKRGRVHAVDGVSLDIRDGETVGLVGETGSGKTVTARSILRLVPAPPGIYAGGEILYRPKEACSVCAGAGCEDCAWSGRPTLDLLRVPERELRAIRGNRIALIFQDPAKALNPALTIRQQVAEVFFQHRADELLRRAGFDLAEVPSLLRRAARRHTTPLERVALAFPPLRAKRQRLDAAIDAAVGDALADTRIPNPRKIMRSYPHELSGGMKQRVMIAQALACNPDLLIADEPTTALDVTIQARILDLIRELQTEHHAAVLYISHDLSLVRRVCDRVAVLYAGQLAEVAPVRELFERPLHPYTRGLLAAIPSAQHRRGELLAIKGTVPEFVEPAPACRFHTRCPHATAVCERKEPALRTRGPHHAAACLAYEDPAELGVGPSELPRVEGVSV